MVLLLLRPLSDNILLIIPKPNSDRCCLYLSLRFSHSIILISASLLKCLYYLCSCLQCLAVCLPLVGCKYNICMERVYFFLITQFLCNGENKRQNYVRSQLMKCTWNTNSRNLYAFSSLHPLHFITTLIILALIILRLCKTFTSQIFY